MNFTNHAVSVIGPLVSEAKVHPHCPDERADLYHAFDGGATEIEILNLLNALVYLFKPKIALESGTARGHGTFAIADAMSMNGFGTLHTVDMNAKESLRAEHNLMRWSPRLKMHTRFHVAKTSDFIESWTGPAFDFAFFDSSVEVRHLEFQELARRGLLSPGAICAFHDSSRKRGETFPDSNLEMIESLDAFDANLQRLEFEFSRGFRLFRMP